MTPPSSIIKECGVCLESLQKLVWKALERGNFGRFLWILPYNIAKTTIEIVHKTGRAAFTSSEIFVLYPILLAGGRPPEPWVDPRPEPPSHQRGEPFIDHLAGAGRRLHPLKPLAVEDRRRRVERPA
jgi:hypothetical protein